MVVVVEPGSDQAPGAVAAGDLLEVGRLVIQRTPQPLDERVVDPSIQPPLPSMLIRTPASSSGRRNACAETRRCGRLRRGTASTRTS